jgi:hypothetical protein
MQRCIACDATLPESYVAEKRDPQNVFCDQLCQKKAYLGGILSLSAGPALFAGEWEAGTPVDEKRVIMYIHKDAPVPVGTARLIIHRVPFTYETVPSDIYQTILPLFLHDETPPEERFLPMIKLVETSNPRRLPWTKMELQFEDDSVQFGAGSRAEGDEEKRLSRQALLEFMHSPACLLEWADVLKLERLIEQIRETGDVTEIETQENRGARLYIAMIRNQKRFWDMTTVSMEKISAVRAMVLSWHSHLLFCLGEFFERNATHKTFTVESRPNGVCENHFTLRVPDTEYDKGDMDRWARTVREYNKVNKGQQEYQVMDKPPGIDHLMKNDQLSLVAFDSNDKMRGFITCTLFYIPNESLFVAKVLMAALARQPGLANASHFCHSLRDELDTRAERFRPFQVLYIDGIHVDVDARGPQNRLAQLLLFYMLRYAQAVRPTVGVSLVTAAAVAGKTVSLLSQFGFDHWNVHNAIHWRQEDVVSYRNHYSERLKRVAQVSEERTTLRLIAGRVRLRMPPTDVSTAVEDLDRAGVALDRYLTGNRDGSAGNVYARYTVDLITAIDLIKTVLPYNRQASGLLTREDVDELSTALSVLMTTRKAEVHANRMEYRGTMASAIQAWRTTIAKYADYFDQAPITTILDKLELTDGMPGGPDKAQVLDVDVASLERWVQSVSIAKPFVDGFVNLMTSLTNYRTDCFLDVSRTDNTVFTRQMQAIANRIAECNNAAQDYVQASTGAQKKKREEEVEGKATRKKMGVVIHLSPELLSDAW